MQPGTSASLKYDTRSVVAAGLCLMSLFFDSLGWVMGVAGIFLLRRAVFPPKVKWILATVALAPKILFLGVRVMNGPSGLSFTIEPRTLATSSSLWALSILLAGMGLAIICLPQQAPRDPNAPVQPPSQRIWLIKLVGLLPIAIAVTLLLGLSDDFQRIDDAGNGRWALKHALRGTVATFTSGDLAGIDVSESHTSRTGSSYRVRVRLADGRTFSAATKSTVALHELRTFATTANLKPGAVRIQQRFHPVWINGVSGFTLKDCTGTYEYTDQKLREHSTYEFWMDGGRLLGREIVLDGQSKYALSLSNIKLSDTGEVEFQTATHAEARELSKGTTSFSLRWSPDGESGRFTKNGLEIGLRKYQKQ